MSETNQNKIVYAFYIPGEDYPIYVGKGNPGRPQLHFCPSVISDGTYFHNKLQQLIDSNIYPDIRILATGLTDEKACDLEISLIKIYGRRDQGAGSLYNLTAGGDTGYDGPNGKGGMLYHQHSIETRHLLSKPTTEIAKLNMSKAKAHKFRPIEQYDLVTKQTTKVYESAHHVTKDGYNRSFVRRVCDGVRPTAHGYGWRWVK